MPRFATGGALTCSTRIAWCVYCLFLRARLRLSAATSASPRIATRRRGDPLDTPEAVAALATATLWSPPAAAAAGCREYGPMRANRTMSTGYTSHTRTANGRTDQGCAPDCPSVDACTGAPALAHRGTVMRHLPGDVAAKQQGPIPSRTTPRSGTAAPAGPARRQAAPATPPRK